MNWFDRFLYFFGLVRASKCDELRKMLVRIAKQYQQESNFYQSHYYGTSRKEKVVRGKQL